MLGSSPLAGNKEQLCERLGNIFTVFIPPISIMLVYVRGSSLLWNATLPCFLYSCKGSQITILGKVVGYFQDSQVFQKDSWRSTRELYNLNLCRAPAVNTGAKEWQSLQGTCDKHKINLYSTSLPVSEQLLQFPVMSVPFSVPDQAKTSQSLGS